MFLSRRRHKKQASILEEPVYWLTDEDPLLVRDVLDGVFISGGVGSGKSSGSARTLALQYLRSGFGGLILCAKVGERKRFEQYARETGREDDLIIVSPETGIRFNFLDYMARMGEGASNTENIVNVLTSATEIATRTRDGQSDQAFFRNAANQAIRNSVELIKLAGEPLSITAIYRVIRSAPRTVAELEAKEWVDSYFGECILKAQRNIESLPDHEQHDYFETVNYWENDYARLPEKTRQSVISTFTSSAEPLTRGVLNNMFSSGVDVMPEDTFDGKIIVVDFPVKQWLFAGTFIQFIFKTLFQQAAERRQIEANSRPVTLFIDECQLFVSEYDVDFLSTSRESRICPVYITQNISNLYAKLGNRELTDAILACLSIKIAHANNDSITNKWIIDHIGQHWEQHVSVSTNRNHVSADEEFMYSVFGIGQPGTSSGATVSEVYAHKLDIEVFYQLRKGGDVNGLKVDAVITQAGRTWNYSQDTWLIAEFAQDF